MDEISSDEKGKKRCWGFPINQTFISMDHLWRTIVATKIHTVNRQDVEFSLVVHIEAYPSNVLSVWVYLAAFVDATEAMSLNLY
jgi:hypothetical protein